MTGKYTKRVMKNWRKENNPHNWESGCSLCKGKFEEDEAFVRVDIETTIFRGDDDVFCFHKKCWKGDYTLSLLKANDQS